MHCAGAAPPQALGAVLGASIQEGPWTIAACPEKGSQGGEASRGQELRGAAEVTWLVQLGEEQARGALIIVYTFPVQDCGDGGADLLSGDQQ